MNFINLDNFKTSEIIKDVILHPLRVNKDEGSGGILVETLRKDWQDVYGEDRDFSMQYYSVTESGAARDENVWHLHPTYQEDRFLLADGEVVVAIADPTRKFFNKRSIEFILYKSPRESLYCFDSKGYISWIFGSL